MKCCSVWDRPSVIVKDPLNSLSGIGRGTGNGSKGSQCGVQVQSLDM